MTGLSKGWKAAARGALRALGFAGYLQKPEAETLTRATVEEYEVVRPPESNPKEAKTAQVTQAQELHLMSASHGAWKGPRVSRALRAPAAHLTTLHDAFPSWHHAGDPPTVRDCQHRAPFSHPRGWQPRLFFQEMVLDSPPPGHPYRKRDATN